MYLLFQVVGLVEVSLGFRGISRQLSDMSDCHRIAIHIGIDRRAQVFLLPSATDGLFHGVLYVCLPVESTIARMGGFPVTELLFQVGQHRYDPVLTTIHLIASPQGVGNPRGVVMEFLHGFALIAPEPGMHDLVEVFRVTDPPALMDMMSYA